LTPPSMDVEREGVISTSRKHLASLGHPVQNALVSTMFTEQGRSREVIRYVRQHLSQEEATTYLNKYQAVQPYWSVRYVIPESPEECQMDMGKNHKLLFFHCRQNEKTPGHKFSPEKTRLLAEKYLEGQMHDLSHLSYVGSTEKDRPNRKDISHKWLDTRANVGELKRYLSVEIQGDRVSMFATNMELPESFLRSERRNTVWDTIQTALLFLLILAAFGFTIRSFFDHHVLAHLRDRLPFKVAAIMAFLPLLEWLNNLPMLWLGYSSTTQMNTFYFETALALLGEMFFSGFLAYLVVLLFATITPQVFPTAPSMDTIRTMCKKPPWQWRGSRAGFFWALLPILLLRFFEESVGQSLSKDATGQFMNATHSAYSTLLPSATAILQVPQTLLVWAAFGTCLAAIKKYSGRWFLRSVFVLGFAYIVAGSWGNWLEVFQGLLTIGTFWFIIVRVVRFHPPFYFWYAVFTTVIPFLPWLFNGPSIFRNQAVIVTGIFAALVISLFAQRRRTKRSAQPVQD